MSRVEAFGADDETHEVLGRLGYSHDEIHAVTSNLPSDMGSEDKVRIGLRALSAEKSRSVSESAEAKVEGFKPHNTPNAEPPPEGDDYWQGRQDEKALGRPSVSGPKPKAEPKPKAAPAPKNPMREIKNLQRLAKISRGKKATARPRRPYR